MPQYARDWAARVRPILPWNPQPNVTDRATSAACSGSTRPSLDVARLAYFALYALQHRGQESAGIATAERGHITTQRDLGLVSQVFDERSLQALTGEMAIGHVRYSTTGHSGWENSQPVYRHDRRAVALGHNGNLINAVDLYNELTAEGVQFRSTSDSEIIAALISTHPAEQIEDAVAEVMQRMRGAYSTVMMTEDRVVAFRDPAGVRPLCLGQLGDRYVVASESCALDIIGAKLLREVQPGELISLGERGIETRIAVESDRPALCVFEHIYFSRPDTKLEGRTLQSVRGRMGEILAREAPVDADLVISVPDSGNAAAKGFARASGIPQDDGLIKNRYVARTFIQPGQELRRHGLRMKFNPLPEVVRGKRLVVVDDSIVRGNTMRQIVQHAARGRREGGPPADVLAADPPPVPLRDRHAHQRGDDRPRAHGGRGGGRGRAPTRSRTCRSEGVYEAVGSGRETHCDACFTGDYPLEGEQRRTASTPWKSSRCVRA